MTRLPGRLRQGHCLTAPRPAAADRDRPASCLDADPRRLRLGLLLLLLLLLLWILTFRGPSEAAEPADQTRRAPHMDVRRFTRGQDAPSENPAGSATPAQRAGGQGGCGFFSPAFFPKDKKRRHP